jgi:APA family basic amino acid/polyamine antiporter
MPPAEPRDPHSTELPKVLGPLEALCVIVGSVIGSGIFLVPATVANNLPYIGFIVLVWVVGGVISGTGALTLAELAAMLPRAGGPYVYLREAYGSLSAFLFGWCEFLVVRAGSMATLAAAFARYFAQVVPAPRGMHPAIWQMFAAVAAMSIVAAVNVVGTSVGGKVQVVGTALKVGALSTMIVLPFVLGQAHVGRLSPAWPEVVRPALFTGFMAALVSVLWAYDGWVNLSELSEEIRDPGKNVPRALILGTIILIALYLGMTLVYHMVLPMDEIRHASAEKGSERAVAADFCRHLLGPLGVVAISLVVMCSTFISLNGNALSGPCAYFAMARDRLFFDSLCRVHPRFRTPSNAVLAQAGWAIMLTVIGTVMLVMPPPGPSSGLPQPVVAAFAKLHQKPLYDVLYTYVIFGATIFYTLAIASVFVLRARRPDLPRPYRTWGYPITPLIYIAFSFVLMGTMLIDTPFESLSGLFLIALGVPVYWSFARRAGATPAGSIAE